MKDPRTVVPHSIAQPAEKNHGTATKRYGVSSFVHPILLPHLMITIKIHVMYGPRMRDECCIAVPGMGRKFAHAIIDCLLLCFKERPPYT